MNGSKQATFLELVRENIEVYGLHWTVKHYSKRMPAWELRFWMRAAYL